MRNPWIRAGLAGVLAALAAGCASAGGRTATAAGTERSARDSIEIRRALAGTPNGAWESTYTPLPSRPTLIRDATVLTATGEEIAGGDVLMRDGRIEAVGADLAAPAGAEVIDATGRWVTPGIIDTHSHLGVYPSPSVSAHSEGNEATDPTTAQVWAVHSVWPQDPGFTRALAGGVTTLQILPGSANLIGGRGITVKPIPARSAQAMMWPGAPMALKMACGENPKRVYEDRGPSTRMGNWAGDREAFIAAERYRKKWDDWVENGGERPDRDLANETLAELLRGHILLHNHCYRSDDMLNMIELSKEFGFHVRSFHHGVEAYKIRDVLAADSIGASVWYDWWGFKMEAFDMVPQNLALLNEAGARAILHTDDPMGIQILNQNAAQAMWAGRRAGIEVSRNDALRWITANPAWALGLAEKVGTLEPGKNADVVIWSGDPFSVYTRADQVFIDGAKVYDRLAGIVPVTDFEAGLPMPSEPEGGSR